MIARRSFLLGFGASLAAPAIVPFESLMPVRAPKLLFDGPWLGSFGGITFNHDPIYWSVDHVLKIARIIEENGRQFDHLENYVMIGEPQNTMFKALAGEAV